MTSQNQITKSNINETKNHSTKAKKGTKILVSAKVKVIISDSTEKKHKNTEGYSSIF